MGSSRLRNTVLAILACMLWSTAFAGLKIGLQYDTPLHFAGTRFFISGLLVLPLALRGNRHYFRILRENRKLLLLLAFLQTFLQYTLLYSGINLIPGSVAAIIIGSQPFFIALVAHFAMPGDRMTWGKTLIILVGILGIVLVSFGRDPASVTGRIAVAGILLLVAVNILSGFTNVLVASERRKIPPLVISSFSMTLGGAALFLVSIPVEGWNPSLRPVPYYLSLGWLSLISAVAISLWITLLKRPGIRVSDLNLWKFLIPVFGAILSWILLPEEYPQWLSVAGMILIAVALVLLNLVNRKTGMQIGEKP